MVHRYLGHILLASLILISLALFLQDTSITGYVIHNRLNESIQIKLTIANSPPVIEPIGVVYYNATDYVNISPTITDLNLDPITTNYSDPLNDSGEWQTTENDWGYYNITLNASDGQGGFDSENFTLVIHGFELNLTPRENSILLNWTDIPEATSYNIYYGNNDSDLELRVTSVSNSYWEDLNPTQFRFYRVGAVINDIVLKSKYVGYFRMALAKDWNLVSLPINLTSYELGEESSVGNPLIVFPRNTLKRIHRYNITTDSFEMTEHIDDYGWVPATGSEDFTKLEPGRGYWFESNQSSILYVIGYYPKEHLTINLDKDYNVVGWYSLSERRLGKESTYGNPLPVDPSNSIKIIHRYRTEYHLFEGVMHFDNWGWWPFTRSESFKYLEPGRGYYFYNTEPSTWEHDP